MFCTLWDYIDSILKWTGWTGVAAIVAAVYTAITYKLFRDNHKLAQTSVSIAQFTIYQNFSKELFTADLPLLLDACISHKLVLDASGKTTINGTTYDFRAAVLEKLEDLEKFRQDGLITLDSINYGYGTLITYTARCPAVQQFIAQQRAVHNSTEYYAGFMNLYNELCTINSTWQPNTPNSPVPPPT